MAGCGTLERPVRTVARPAGARSVSVAIDAAHPGRAVPPGFVGLSFEAGSLAELARGGGRGDIVALLRSLRAATVRFGGNGVDAHTAWVDAAHRRPPWAATAITAADLARLDRAARASGSRVLLGLTLGHFDAERAVAEAVAARVALGSRLAAVEIGNEPDQYVRKRLRRPPWGYGRYRRQVDAYRAALARAAGRVALAGPDLASAADLRWIGRYARDERPAVVTAHYYPLTACAGARPTLAQLLGPAVRAAEERTLRRLAALAASRGLPLRLGETNDTSCRGYRGVSNTFGSALWALAYVVDAIRAGAAGVNFHDLPASCRGYSPLCARNRRELAAGRLHAQPKWYALLAAAQVAGGRVLATATARPPAGLTVQALRAPDGSVHVVIVDTAPPRSGALDVRLPAARRSIATVLRLTGPSPGASAGVTLGGRPVGSDGAWRPPPAPRLPHAPWRAGAVTVRIAPASAALVTIAAR